MKLLCFLTFGFYSKCTFLRLQHFISPSAYPINSFFFSVVVCIYKNHVFDETFFLLAIVAMITEKCIFPISMANFLTEKSLHQIMQLVNPDYPWNKWNQGVSCSPSLRSETLIIDSKWISIFFFIFNTICYHVAQRI